MVCTLILLLNMIVKGSKMSLTHLLPAKITFLTEVLYVANYEHFHMPHYQGSLTYIIIIGYILYKICISKNFEFEREVRIAIKSKKISS